MKLYTKTGDDGSTGLFGGQRVKKDALRIEACGDVDETNSAIGVALSACRHKELQAVLNVVQNRLFEVGADLATPFEKKDTHSVTRIGPAHIAEIEKQIDDACEPLPAMKHFILPGGSELAAKLHMARTICRRAERRCFTLSRSEDTGSHVMIYLNRLSDLLFALARRANQLDDIDDVPWIPS